jgi:hypothetical protein
MRYQLHVLIRRLDATVEEKDSVSRHEPRHCTSSLKRCGTMTLYQASFSLWWRIEAD